ncbi:MAG: hypothetical protein KDB86_12980 [Actinobacteria bacterium]|nr:hypothetical protein [Actinomycetota bacterium]MCB9389663.1 hypothetical protein [Acidimicrobiia bacterium]
MAARRVQSVRVLVVVGLVALMAAALIVMAGGRSASAQGIHGTLVPETPRLGADRILDGEIMALEQIGDRILVGGDFTTVTLADGSTVAQPYLAAFDANTGLLDQTFRPAIDGAVRAVIAGPDDTLIIGGEFRSVSNRPRKKLAQITAVDGVATADWVANANARVSHLSAYGDRLFVGGDFTKIDGVTQSRLAELSLATGDINTNFTIGSTGDRTNGTRSDGWSSVGWFKGAFIQGLEVFPDGQHLMVAHRGSHIGGQARSAIAIIDIRGTTPVVTPYNTNLWPASDFVGITDADLSPDGSYVVLTNILGNSMPLHDSVIAFPTTDFNDNNVLPIWVTQMFDSAFSVAVSDVAVYIGGHFCWTEGPTADASSWDKWPGTDGNQYSCYGQGGGVFDHTVYRYHQAALDPATGRALDWESPANSNVGAKVMTVTDRGLLVGHDGDRMNQIKVGRWGFYDLGAPTPPPPPPAPECNATVEDAGLITVAWSNVNADPVQVRRDGSWVSTVSGTSYSETLADGTYAYEVRWRDAGQTTTIPCTPDPLTVGEVTTCVASVDAASAVTLAWPDAGVTSYQVRRDGSWLTTVDAPGYTDTAVSAGDHTYVIRYRAAGVVTDLTCSPDPVTVP